jgi:acid phosphatase family membrane protein YuiD
MPEWHGEQIVETTTEARQGVTGHNVRYVLVWSTVGVIVAFVIVYFLFFSDDPSLSSD